jgi:hypothetical protein
MFRIISTHVHERMQICSKDPKTMLDSGENHILFYICFCFDILTLCQ